MGQRAQPRGEREGFPRGVPERRPGHVSACAFAPCRSHARPVLREDGAGRTRRASAGKRLCGEGAGCWERPRAPPARSAGPSSARREGGEAGTESLGLRCKLRQSPQSRDGPPKAETVLPKPRRSPQSPGGAGVRATLQRRLASGAGSAPALLSRAAHGVRSGAAGAWASGARRRGLGAFAGTTAAC